MPERRDVFINGKIYHIYNKSIDDIQTFRREILSSNFLEVIRYYRSTKAHLRFSYYRRLKPELKEELTKQVENVDYFRTEVLCYCLMPNHFHLLIRQTKDQGVVRFMSDVLNSFTRFYNTVHDRKGPVFLPQFRSRMITTREHFIHVSRYIHLNPYSSSMVLYREDLDSYALSSFPEYVTDKFGLCNTKILLDCFKGNKDSYKKFVYDNADYQRSLEEYKHLGQ